MREIVFTVGTDKPEEHEQLLTQLRAFLRSFPNTFGLSDPDLIDSTSSASVSSAEEDEALTASYNWVLSCRVAPSTEDEG